MKPSDHLLGFLAGLLTSAGLTAQLIQIVWTWNASGVNEWFAVFLLSGYLLWLYYGIVRRDVVLTFWNVYGIACCTFVLLLKIVIGGMV
jgi:uncharacterized protein with PQ loop repeat